MEPAHRLSLAGTSVFLAMPTHRDLHPLTVCALLETQEAVLRTGRPFQVYVGYASSLVHHARSKLAIEFLESEHTHLFWVDSDILWKSADFMRLWAFGTKLTCVGATYTAKREPPDFMLGRDGTSPDVETNEFGCIPVGGLGMGFTIVQRGLVERLAAKAPRVEFPDVKGGPSPHIFRCDIHKGMARGEDMAFFADVRALGETVWLDPSITLGHIGAKTYRASIMDYLQEQETNVAANESSPQ